MNTLTHWSEHAACTTKTTLFDAEGRTEYTAAKKICRTCPVISTCLNSAMQEEGEAAAKHRACVRGGLSPAERAAWACTPGTDTALIAKAVGLLEEGLTDKQISSRLRVPVRLVRGIRQPIGIQPTAVPMRPVHSPQEAFHSRTTTVPGGHMEWIGDPDFRIGQARWTSRRAAFVTFYGRAPVGRVQVECLHPGCVAPRHLSDKEMRTQAPPECGSVGGLGRHRIRGEAVCDRCRAAGAEADGRLTVLTRELV